MEIKGPIKLSIIDDDQSMNRELQLSFTQEFQDATVAERSKQFVDYINTLRQQIGEISDNNDATRQGLMTVLQITEELLPHIRNDEVPLQDTIAITIESGVKITFDPKARTLAPHARRTMPSV